MLLSSLAESIYWFGRYVERTENTARMILVNDALLLDIPSQCNPGWAPVIQIIGSSEIFYEHYNDAGERNVLRYLVADCKNNPGSMLSSVIRARENLRICRALFPQPVWEVHNDLYAYLQENGPSVSNRKQRYRFMREVIDHCHLLAGKLAVSMSHDEVYEFVKMGFNIERADMTSRVIDVRAQSLLHLQAEGPEPFSDIQWKSILDSLAAWQMYRRRAHIRINGADVLRFLLQDRHFPRSISHCLLQLEQSLYSLGLVEVPRRALVEAQRMLRNVRIPAVLGASLHDFIDELQLCLMAIHDELDSRYFGCREEVAKPAVTQLSRENAGLAETCVEMRACRTTGSRRSSRPA